MKHTAVEWLLDQLENQVSDDGKQTMSLKVTGFLREQAKEIEKQQIIDAYGVKVKHSIEQGTTVYTQTFGEQYYNETFNK